MCRSFHTSRLRFFLPVAMFCGLWLLFLAVLVVSASNPAQTIQRAKTLNTAPPNTTFITTHNGQFFVNGRYLCILIRRFDRADYRWDHISVFKAIGTNAYWLSALNTEQDMDATLASIRAANFTVVRTWAFNGAFTVNLPQGVRL